MSQPLLQAKVDLAAIRRNIDQLRACLQPGVRMLAAVKADAYGHGMLPVAHHALGCGVDMLGVARLPEAVALRRAGILSPILIFGHTLAEDAPALIRYRLKTAVSSKQAAAAYSQIACAHDGCITIHLKIDTGMGRLGMLADPLQPGSNSALDDILAIARMPGLEIEGIFTHFAQSDAADKSHARHQLQIFIDLLETLETAGLRIPIRHAANSAATMEMPESHLDMVRPGIALYGLYPSDAIDRNRITLTPAMTLAARITHIKQVSANFSISYGSTHTTAAPAVIATIPVGYADGFSRAHSSNGDALVNGRRAPIVGRVCMDQTMLDITGIDAEIGDEAVLFGQQAGETLSADEVAGRIGTINYEVTAALTARVARVYR